MVLFALSIGIALGNATPETPCLSLMHRMAQGPIPVQDVSSDSAQSRVMEKQARMPLGGLPQSLKTTNFLIQWGVFDGFSTSDIEQLATALETSWAIQVDEKQYPVPRGANTYLINVYIGNTHESAPKIYSNARAYVDTDDEGYARIVISPSLLRNAAALKTTAAHEFFHTIQWHANADYIYAPGSPANWYWEATAVWMEQEVYPESTEHHRHLPNFLFFPELPLSHFPTEWTGTLSDSHAYGAFLFPLYLQQILPSAPLIRESFTNTQGQSDPLQVLDRLLNTYDTTLKETFFGFSAANGTLAYPQREAFLEALDEYGGYNSAYSNRPSGTLSYHNAEWKSDATHFPASLGVNYWNVVPSTDPYSIHIDSFEDGDWFAALVSFDGSTHTSQTIEWQGQDSVRVEIDTPLSESWLVVSVIDSSSDTRIHPYRVSFQTKPKRQDTGDTGSPPQTERGCATKGSVNLPIVGLIGLLVLLRRRRQDPLHFAHQTR